MISDRFLGSPSFTTTWIPSQYGELLLKVTSYFSLFSEGKRIPYLAERIAQFKFLSLQDAVNRLILGESYSSSGGRIPSHFFLLQ
jgi:hypothetical protein